jgi:hypothetical protein
MTSSSSDPDERSLEESGAVDPHSDSKARPPSAGATASDVAWVWAALACGLLATAIVFHDFVDFDLRTHAPANLSPRAQQEPESVSNWDALATSDLRFVVWLIARDVHSLLQRPTRFFSAEQCFPATDALAYGESGLAMGVLALPFRAFGDHPILIFNLTLIAMTWLSAAAMFLLVRLWTASAPAGIVAAILYAFHFLKLGDVVHIIIWDTTWTVFALYFATRVFSEGRPRDNLGLAVSVAMQIAGSAYPLFASFVIAIPFIVWLIHVHGAGRLRWLPVLGLIVSSALVFTFALGPYLSGSAAGSIGETPYHVYRPLSYLLPGGDGFSGWTIIALVFLCVALGRRYGLRGIKGDPRLAIGIGALVIFALAVVGEGEPGQATYPVVRGHAPPEGFPNLYLALIGWFPGLDVIRGPGAMYSGVHLALCLLAGVGAAALLARLPASTRFGAATLLIAFALIDTLRPPFLGLTPRYDFEMVDLSPTEDELALVEAIQGLRRAEPEELPFGLLEVPVRNMHLSRSARGLLLTAYHHEPTSFCYNSFFPNETQQVESISARLPESTALDELYDLGFRILVVHHAEDQVGAEGRRKLYRVFAAGEASDRLPSLLVSPSITAYRITP